MIGIMGGFRLPSLRTPSKTVEIPLAAPNPVHGFNRYRQLLMTRDAIKNHPRRHSVSLWLVLGWCCFLGESVQAGDNGQLAEFNTTQPYCIYYGNWTAGQVDYARTNYHLVILHPASNITSNQIATIRSGKDDGERLWL